MKTLGPLLLAAFVPLAVSGCAEFGQALDDVTPDLGLTTGADALPDANTNAKTGTDTITPPASITANADAAAERTAAIAAQAARAAEAGDAVSQTFASGAEYNGQLRDGKQNGVGTYKAPDGFE